MKKLITFGTLLSLALFGAGCNSTSKKPLSNVESISVATSTNETSASTTTSMHAVYSVDDFVMTVFKQGGRIRIQVNSVTCYNNSCGFDGKKYGINLNQEESKPFLPLSGKGASFIVEVEAACPKESAQCNAIKNIRVVNE